MPGSRPRKPKSGGGAPKRVAARSADADPAHAADGSESGEHTLRRIIGERRDKASALRAAGHNPYRNDFKPSHTCAEVRAMYENTRPDESAPAAPGITPVDDRTVAVAGRVVARRGFGKTVFAPIRDATGDLQLFINVDHLDPGDFADVVSQLDTGDIAAAEGPVFWTKRGEMSVLCKRLRILTKSLRPLPDKHKGLTNVETRYRQRYLDLAVNPEVREVFRARARIVQSIRGFLDTRDFLEVETPMMHPIIGGAAARPFVTHHNALDMQLYMRIAPELYLKRLVVGGLDRVYEINRNFRNEGLSRKHNPEFTMLEFYMAYATYEDLIVLTEELVTQVARDVVGVLQLSWEGADIDLGRPWVRMTIRDAVVELGGQPGEVFEDPARAAEVAVSVGVDPGAVIGALIEPLGGEELAAALRAGGSPWSDGDADLVTDAVVAGLRAAFADPHARPRLTRALCERYPDELTARVRAGHLGYMIFEQTVEDRLVQPTFMTRYPLAVSPLSRKSEDDPAFCDRFELFVLGREICNAFSELNDPDDQRERFLAQLRAREHGADETMDYDEDYCRALELGLPPCAGEGLGIDRLTMMLTDQPSIRDVILFPLMRPE